ncbi:uncharacterized protein LOC123564830 isoform X1 [Mercenaria mercenaria]|uniref:uncharacterized protein LOC123564830 isoform X1 n=1 Tax=Mercenaria mercenaria TaxID=6596 RepID=UPI00234E5644|nr:uncharacterized protein LOC123564830 isoform X1 [Mercenaria mercenaria]XP_053393420.1 uncharacterized protein LOC123564830 isoform X1 [Mercenaria mercenaria]
MSHLQEQLTCSICLELYNDPVRLVCFHVFCQKCIAANMNIPDRRPVCPECNTPIENSFPPKKDFKIAALIQTIKETPKCREHNDDNNILEEYKADVLCKTCCKLLCVACAFGQGHRNHEMEDLKSAITKQKELLAKKMPGTRVKLLNYMMQRAKTKKARKDYYKCEVDSISTFKRMVSDIQAHIDKLKTDGEEAIQVVTEEFVTFSKEKESELTEKIKWAEQLIKSYDEFEKDPANSFKVMKENAEKSFESNNSFLPELTAKSSVAHVFRRSPVIKEGFVQLSSMVNSFLQKIENNLGEGFVCRLQGLPCNVTTDGVIEWFGGSVRIVPNGVHILNTCKGHRQGEAFIELVAEKDVEAALTRHKDHMGYRYIEVYRSKRSEMEDAVKKSNRRSYQLGDGKNRQASEMFDTENPATDEEYSLPKIKYCKGNSGKAFHKATKLNKHTVSSCPSSEAPVVYLGSSRNTALSDDSASSPETSLTAVPSTSGDSGLDTSASSVEPSTSVEGFKIPVVGSKNLSEDVNAAIQLIAEANFSTEEFSSFLMFFQNFRNEHIGLTTRLSKVGFANIALQDWKQVPPFQKLGYKFKAHNTEKYQRALGEYTAFFS